MNFVSFIKNIKLYESKDVDGSKYTVNLSDFAKKDKDITKTFENVLSYFVGSIVELNEKIENLEKQKINEQRTEQVNPDYSFSAYVSSQIKTNKCVVMLVKDNVLSVIKSDGIGKIFKNGNQISVVYKEKNMYNIIPSFFSVDGIQMSPINIIKSNDSATFKLPCDNVIIVLDFVN